MMQPIPQTTADTTVVCAAVPTAHPALSEVARILMLPGDSLWIRHLNCVLAAYPGEDVVAQARRCREICKRSDRLASAFADNAVLVFDQWLHMS